MMFIPHDQRHMYRMRCLHCSMCKWCQQQCLIKNCFTMRDGPTDHRFCNAICAHKWVNFRHKVGVAHVVRMPPQIRAEYLKGKSIDEYISDVYAAQCDASRS